MTATHHSVLVTYFPPTYTKGARHRLKSSISDKALFVAYSDGEGLYELRNVGLEPAASAHAPDGGFIYLIERTPESLNRLQTLFEL